MPCRLKNRWHIAECRHHKLSLLSDAAAPVRYMCVVIILSLIGLSFCTLSCRGGQSIPSGVLDDGVGSTLFRGRKDAAIIASTRTTNPQTNVCAKASASP